MKRYRLSYSEEGLSDLNEIKKYIAEQSSARKALAYVQRIKRFCRELEIAPHRGEHRSDLHSGYRTIGFARRVSIVFAVDDEARIVRVIGFHYAGRSWNGPGNMP